MNLNNICFIDLEVTKHSDHVYNIAALCGQNKFVTTSINELSLFVKQSQAQFICGHNFIEHDAKYLFYTRFQTLLLNLPIIDTLYWSLLLFPDKTTHYLEKPYKSEINIENDPLIDCQQTKLLFEMFLDQINNLPAQYKEVIFRLTYNDHRFNGMHKLVNYSISNGCFTSFIADFMQIDRFDELDNFIINKPVELAIAASYIHIKQKSLAQFILMKFPSVVYIVLELKNLCKKIDIAKFSQQEFGFSSFRSFNGLKTNDLFAEDFKISQLEIVEESLTKESLLVILPTGGGKTFTFQLPALIKAFEYKGLTVVISPLQALMKNHVDGFKSNNYRAIAVSGYLSAVERSEALRLVINGMVDILYLAPEALRSNSIINVLKKRVIERFVIDEAHCFSSWGHDFRHDYNYIANIIAELQQQEFQPPIPVSCFTATAKPEVLQDIKDYFFNKLNIKLKSYIAESERTNLSYRVVSVADDSAKYEQLIQELEQLNGKPTIIYRPQNARGCKELAEQLSEDPRIDALRVEIEPFYAKIDDEISQGRREGRDKNQILTDFIENRINIVVATTAFGMGIDKPNIKAVIHYDPSDSIEAYMQEAGRGARDPKEDAECIVFYNNQDFNRSFTQLNRSKLDYEEIRRVVNTFKKEKRNEFYLTTRQIADSMGLDTDDMSLDHSAIIKTAILELEKANIIQRERDKTVIYGTSVKTVNNQPPMEYVHDVLSDEEEKHHSLMILIMQNIIQRSKLDSIEIDELAHIIGYETKSVFNAIQRLQAKGLIDYDNDISIYINNKAESELIKHFEFEDIVWQLIINSQKLGVLNLRELNHRDADNNKQSLQNCIKDAKKIIRSWVRITSFNYSGTFIAKFHQDICRFEINSLNTLKMIIDARRKMCTLIVQELMNGLNGKSEFEIEIPLNKLFNELKEKQLISLEGFHYCLVYLHDLLTSFKLRKGRLIYHHSFKICKLPRILESRPYQKLADYNKTLAPYYQRKIEAIHILIKLLEMILHDGWSVAKLFVADYFALNNQDFKKKYSLAKSYLPVTEEQQSKILQNINDEQRLIINDDSSQAILVVAGPGSGKTKTLVHKIATLITVEQQKPEYFLMLAHSRVAVAEFRERLKNLIGDLVYSIEIMTFHAYAIKIAGKVITSESDMKNAIEVATRMLKNNYQLPLKTMLVLDEYQDVSQRSYEFIRAIYDNMGGGCRIIAVGDDDQCINNFPGADGADIKFMQCFVNDFAKNENDDEHEIDGQNIKRNARKFTQYNLANNYRSLKNLVIFASNFANHLQLRLKHSPLIPQRKRDIGNINIYRYPMEYGMLHDAVNYIVTNKLLNCALLFRSNDEVITAYSLLLTYGIKARYLVDNEGFELGQLQELCSFLNQWSLFGTFKRAEEWFLENFKNSADFELAKNVIERFYQMYESEIERAETHFMMLFNEYLSEIQFSEFDNKHHDITIATMHKAKGKEFDNVVLVINKLSPLDGFDLRLAYVGITRAKDNLTIFTACNIFDSMKDLCTTFEMRKNTEINEKNLIFIMKLRDIWLQYDNAQENIARVKPVAGDKLNIFCTPYDKSYKFEIRKNGKILAMLARADDPQRVSHKIIEKLSDNYVLNPECVVEHVVRWVNKDRQEYYQVLCKISLSKSLSYPGVI